MGGGEFRIRPRESAGRALHGGGFPRFPGRCGGGWGDWSPPAGAACGDDRQRESARICAASGPVWDRGLAAPWLRRAGATGWGSSSGRAGILSDRLSEWTGLGPWWAGAGSGARGVGSGAWATWTLRWLITGISVIGGGGSGRRRWVLDPEDGRGCRGFRGVWRSPRGISCAAAGGSWGFFVDDLHLVQAVRPFQRHPYMIESGGCRE